jgi:hypothetical protein
MASMTDQNRVNAILQAYYTSSTAFTITPGTGGGSAFTITPPFHLRLMTAQGSNTSNGTEATSGNCPGYTAGGVTMGSSAFGSPSGGSSVSSNSQSWTATGGWTAIVAVEGWDTAATPLRYFQGAITSVTLANGNTLNFPAGGVTLNASTW